MAYNTKLKTDVNGKPIPQYYNQATREYEALEGANGAARHIIYGADGNPIATAGNKLAVRASEIETLLESLDGKDFATQATVAEVLAKLSDDPATQTTLAAILAKIIAAPATEAKQDAIIGHVDGIEGAITNLNDKDFATQTTLATLLTKAGFDAKADIALTAFRDAIRGAESKTLTDLATALAPLATSAKQAEAIAALGAIANAAVTDPAANGTAIALLKGLLSRIQTLENKIDSITDGTSPATVQLSGSNVEQTNGADIAIKSALVAGKTSTGKGVPIQVDADGKLQVGGITVGTVGIDQTTPGTSNGVAITSSIESVAAAPVVGVKTITATAAEIFAGASIKASRRKLIIRNEDSVLRLRVGPSSVTQQNGYPIEPGGTLEILFDPTAQVAIYGISEGAALSAAILEV